MAMSKKDFIALADAIRLANDTNGERPDLAHDASCAMRFYGASECTCDKDSRPVFDETALDTLANFCKSQNGNFLRDRWLDYIAGKCGPNGGAR